MNTPTNLRNIGIIAHVDAGKTTVTEQMLFLSGQIRSLGSVDQGTAHTDWLGVERERGISVRAAATLLSWQGVAINLIDTPGHVDFAAEVERALRVLDAAILIVSAVEGVQAQTEIYWKALRAMNLPALIFINKIDRIGAESGRVLEEIRRLLSPAALPLQIPADEGSANPALIDLSTENPGQTEAQFRKNYDRLVEMVSEQDESLLEKYLQNEPVSPATIQSALPPLVHHGTLFPVLYGAALKGIGVKELLDAVVRYLPHPSGVPHQPVSGVVFKIEHDPSQGKVAYVRLYDGLLKNRDPIYNLSRDLTEKVTQIRKISGSKATDTGILSAGDIAGVCGLSKAKVGDILGSPASVPPAYHFTTPPLRVKVAPTSEGDLPRLMAALEELTDEDPLLGLEWLPEERELHLNITGVIQLEILEYLLKSRFGLTAAFSAPTIIYKETPTRTGEGFVAYTMPKPCWAILKFQIEPDPRGSGLVYASTVRAENLLPAYQHQVAQAIPDALKQGLHGWEVTDLKITLVEGEHHVYHTHPLDFIVATPMGIMDGLANTGTTLLEPMLKIRITAPETVGGKILHDLTMMRGTFDNPMVSRETFTVEGIVPVATSLDYAVRLGGLTSGKGSLTTSFAGYRECPLELGATCPRRGINPLDRSRYILAARKAIRNE